MDHFLLYTNCRTRCCSSFPGESMEPAMVVTVYVEGRVSPDGQHIALPLSSCAVLLVVSYADPSNFHVVFVQAHTANAEQSPNCYVIIPRTGKLVCLRC